MHWLSCRASTTLSELDLAFLTDVHCNPHKSVSGTPGDVIWTLSSCMKWSLIKLCQDCQDCQGVLKCAPYFFTNFTKSSHIEFAQVKSIGSIHSILFKIHSYIILKFKKDWMDRSDRSFDQINIRIQPTYRSWEQSCFRDLDKNKGIFNLLGEQVEVSVHARSFL